MALTAKEVAVNRSGTKVNEGKKVFVFVDEDVFVDEAVVDVNVVVIVVVVGDEDEDDDKEVEE